MLLSSIPKLIGFRACIPTSLSETVSQPSSAGSSTESLHRMPLKSLTLEESLQLNDPNAYLHAAHCLLYCKTVDCDVEGLFGLCQVRFDGLIGFPGGIVGDKEPLITAEDLLVGLKRELEEEINFKPREDDINGGFEHVSTYFDETINPTDIAELKRVNIFHFFIKEISEKEFTFCETNHLQSIHFPLESLGLFRIPLIDPINCDDRTVFRYYKEHGGFLTNFFKSNFAGIARAQLFGSLVYLDCLTPEYLATLEKIILK